MDAVFTLSSDKAGQMSSLNIKEMTASEYHQAVVMRDYVDNPLKAKEMYNWAKNFVSEALEGEDSRNMSTHVFARTICRYLYHQGIKTMKDVENILNWTKTKWINDNLRVEFDEEYVELY